MGKSNYFVDVDTLVSEGVLVSTIYCSLEINRSGKLYNKIAILAKNHKDIAIAKCVQYSSLGYDCFITETNSYLSIWKENKLDLTNAKTLKHCLEEDYTLNYCSVDSSSKSNWLSYVKGVRLETP